MLRGAAGAIVVATGLTATALSANAIRDKRNGSKHTDTARSVPVQVQAQAKAPVDSTRVASDSVARSAATTPAVVAVAPAATKPAAPVPVIKMGSSALPDGISAQRTDSAVTLSFDTPMTRTRRAEKFEQLVRSTLPAVYGKAVDSALAAMPAGSLAKQGDLLTELPTRGVRIPVDSAWEIRVFPETRKGVEGPLVIRYRAAAVAR